MSKQDSTFLDVVNFLADNVDDTASSLPEYLSGTRNDFLTLVEAPIADIPEIKDILNEVNVLVASYYIASLTMHIGLPEMSIRKDLDKFSVERSPLKTAIKFALALGVAYAAGKTGAKLLKSTLGLEGFSGTMGAPDKFAEHLMLEGYKNATHKDLNKMAAELDVRENRIRSREDKIRNDIHTIRNSQRDVQLDRREDKIKDREENIKTKLDGLKNTSDKTRVEREYLKLEKEKKALEDERKALDDLASDKGDVTIGKGDVSKQLHEGGSLACGKTFDLTIERNGAKMPLMVDVGLAVLVAESAAMETILSVGGYEYSFEHRKMTATPGTREWVRNVVFSRDLIDAMRQNRNKDKTGFYKSIVATRSKNWLSSLFGNVSVNNASSAIVVTQATIDKLEPILGGSLEDYDIRSRLFKDTLTMLIFVVDMHWETVSIYHRGMRRFTEINLRDLRKSGKSGNMDVSEIIRAYQAGNTPALR